MTDDRKILLTGATGYVGGRLLRRLERAGHRVRCLARSPEALQPRVGPTTEVVRGDVLEAESLEPAMTGVEVAFYLVHSMGDTGDFMAKELEAARNFSSAARAAGVRRIVYLGGLGGDDLSRHLASRQQVGDVLRESDVPTIELRSSVIIGSGSASFEMVRALVNHLPVMVTPRWVHVRTQPIAIEDVLEYLLAAVDVEAEGSVVVEIGAPDVVSYAELMKEYARQQGLRRILIPVPVLTPRLSSLWLGLVTPLYARVGRKLIGSLRNETVVRESGKARQLFPGIEPRSVAAAIERAIVNEDEELAETRWSDAVSSKGAAGPRRSPATAVSAAAAACSTAARSTSTSPQPRPSRRSSGSAASVAGTSPMPSGRRRVFSTCSWEASACGGGGVIR